MGLYRKADTCEAGAVKIHLFDLPTDTIALVYCGRTRPAVDWSLDPKDVTCGSCLRVLEVRFPFMIRRAFLRG